MRAPKKKTFNIILGNKKYKEKTHLILVTMCGQTEYFLFVGLSRFLGHPTYISITYMAYDLKQIYY